MRLRTKLRDFFYGGSSFINEGFALGQNNNVRFTNNLIMDLIAK